MDAIKYFAQLSMKKNAPELRPGDTVRVHQKIREGNKERIQIFEGVVMAVRGGRSINSSFVVRRIASGVGTERTFPLHSPNVVKVERVKSSKVRQARLYYLRQRFGRNARMRNEEWSQQMWDESSNVEVVVDNETPSEDTQEAEAPAEETVTENEAVEAADSADNADETVEPASEEAEVTATEDAPAESE